MEAGAEMMDARLSVTVGMLTCPRIDAEDNIVSQETSSESF